MRLIGQTKAHPKFEGVTEVGADFGPKGLGNQGPLGPHWLLRYR
jgi:hypothetical protein